VHANKVLRAIGQHPICTPVRELRMSFQMPYTYDYTTKLCRQQAKVVQNRENENVHSIGKDETRARKYKGLKLGSGQACWHSSV
jgi:hypothetical protein